MWPLEESHGLYWSPTDNDSVAWSEDNLIAVASGAGAVILNPCDLEGVIAATPAALGDFCHLQHLPLSALHGQGTSILCSAVLQAMQPGAFNSDLNGFAKVRALAWSPSGLSSVSGCVLGTLTDDFRVKLFARPAAAGAQEWECYEDLADRLAGHLGHLPIPNLLDEDERALPEPAAAPRPAASPAAAAATAPKPATKSKQAAAPPPAQPAEAAGTFAAGQDVEVSVDDAGMQDDWFVGKVQQLAPGHMLVQYGTDEGGGQRQEWFLRPDVRGAAGPPSTGHAVRGAGCTLRPPPPPILGEQAFRGRDRVDVWQDGRWQGCALTRTRNVKARIQLPARIVRHVRPAAGGEERRLEPDAQLRHSLAWRGGARWDRLPKAAALNPGERTPDASVAGSPPATTPSTQAPASEAPPERREAGEAQPASGAPGVGSAEPSTAPASDEASAETRSQPAPASRGRGRGRGRGRSASATPAARGRGGGRGRGRSRGASSSAGRGRGRRRKRATSSESESSGSSDDFEPEGSEAGSEDEGGAARVLAGLAASRSTRATKRARGSPAAAPAAAVASPSPRRRPSHPGQYMAEEYQVPDDFDPAVLPPLGETNVKSAFVQDLAHAAAERWLELRCAVPEDEVPMYEKGAHLRGPDVVNYERVRAEFTHAHAALLERWGVDQKQLNMECKRCIRVTAIKPRAQLEDSEAEGEAAAAAAAGAEPPRRRSQTELLLRRVRKAREQRHASALGRRQQQQQQPKQQQGKRPSTASKVSLETSPATANGTIHAPVATEAQLQLLAPTCLAWSGLLRLPGPGQHAASSLLAVGTRAGVVWLWALQARPPRLEPDRQAEAAGVRLVGRLPVGSAGLTCLAWAHLGATPWLLAGDASGAVLAAPLDRAGLAPAASRTEQPRELRAAFAPLVPADGRGVTSLAADVAGGQVRVAAGKQPGVLLVWTGALPPGSGGGQLSSVAAAHGTLPLSGTAWLPQPEGPAAEGCLLTTGCDGSAKAWRMRGSQAQPAAELAPQQLAGDVQPYQLQANAFFGVAPSGSGRLAAVVLETLNARQDTVQEVMMYRKIIKARLHLLPLAALLACRPEQAAAAAAAALEQAAQGQGRLCAGRLWDLAAELHWRHPPAQEQAGGSEAAPAVCSAPATQALLERLQAGAPALLAGEASASEAGQEPAWRRLQLANVLLRLLHPRRISQAEAETDEGSSPPATEFSRAWDAQLAANELLLLQRQVLRLLHAGQPAAGLQLCQRLARQWAAQHAAALRPELRAALAPLRPSEQAACEQALGVPVGLARGEQPLQTARMAEPEGLGLRLARCGASLALLPPGKAWACGLCGRCYSRAAAEGGLLPHLACLFCGTALSVRHRVPGVCLAAPGWPALLPPPPAEPAAAAAAEEK